MEDGVIASALHDKRIPIKAWMVVYPNGARRFHPFESRPYFRTLPRNGEPNYVRPEVEPVTIHFGHEPEGLRDAW